MPVNMNVTVEQLLAKLGLLTMQLEIVNREYARLEAELAEMRTDNAKIGPVGKN